MKNFVSVFAVAVVVLVVLLCAGCKRRETLAPPVEEELIGPAIGPGEEIVLPPEVPSIADFAEPEDTAVFQDIHFDFDRSDIRPVDRPTLQAIAEHLTANPSVYLLIEGHCDERGTNEYNLALGERRALSTRAFLVGLGVEGQMIVTITLGEESPINPGHDEAAWTENRRAHFKVAIKGGEVTEVTEAPEVVE